MGSGINNKINEFLCNSKNVRKRRNTRLEKCYGHVNIATAKIYCSQSVFYSHKMDPQIQSNNKRPFIHVWIICFDDQMLFGSENFLKKTRFLEINPMT